MSKPPVPEPSRNDKALPENRESLWPLIFGPTIWALHFLLSYITAAVWCAKVAGRSGSLDVPQFTIGVYTLLALLAIGLTAWRGYRRLCFSDADVLKYDRDTDADRYHFLGFATLLLCGLSFVATLYVAFAIVFIGSCR